MIDWVINVIELLLEKTPIVGKIIGALEKDYPLRQLSPEELLREPWLSALRDFLNKAFKTDYSKEYSTEQLAGWINTYSESFVVFVQRKVIGKKLFSERIVATVKIFPLKEDRIRATGTFDSYAVTPDQLASNEKDAAAIWVGDLVSTNQNLILLMVAIRYKVGNLNVPIYCRTVVRKLRHILLGKH